MQEIWNRQGPSQDADSFRCNTVSLRVKSSLGTHQSSSISFNEIRLACINCPCLYFKMSQEAYMVCGACYSTVKPFTSQTVRWDQAQIRAQGPDTAVWCPSLKYCLMQ